MFDPPKKSHARVASFLTLALLALSIPLSLMGSAQAAVIPSEVTIKFKEGPTLFKGKVTSDLPECREGRLVTVFKVRKGPDKTVGSDLTNARGKWKVDVNHANGRYYAKVKRSQLGGYYGGGDTCAKARSDTIEV